MQYPEAFDHLLFSSKREFDGAALNVEIAYCVDRLRDSISSRPASRATFDATVAERPSSYS
jgi:hypothetical protein